MTLPDDVLLDILKDFNPKYLLKFGTLCRRFRDVSLQAYGSWGVLSMRNSGLTKSFMRLCIERSKGHGLSIEFDVDIPGTYDSETSSFLDIVLPHRAQWRELVIDIILHDDSDDDEPWEEPNAIAACEEMCSSLHGLDLPQLEKLFLRQRNHSANHDYYPGGLDDGLFSSWIVPRLKDVSLYNVTPRQTGSLLTSLKVGWSKSKMGEYLSDPQHHLLSLIQASSSTLSTLHISLDSLRISLATAPPLVDLPCVKSFALTFIKATNTTAIKRDSAAMSYLLDHLRMPSLTEFELMAEIRCSSYRANDNQSKSSDFSLESSDEKVFNLISHWLLYPPSFRNLVNTTIRFLIEPSDETERWKVPIGHICSTTNYCLGTNLRPEFVAGGFCGQSRVEEITLEKCINMDLQSLASLISCLEAVGAFPTLRSIVLDESSLMEINQKEIEALVPSGTVLRFTPPRDQEGNFDKSGCWYSTAYLKIRGVDY